MLHELNSASDNNIFDTVLDFYGDDFPFKEIPDFFSDLMKMQNAHLLKVDQFLKFKGTCNFN